MKRLVEGRERGVCLSPVKVRIKSPDVPNLTIVDLPGIIKNPMSGQTEKDVKDIHEMIDKFIEPENCFILAVCDG